MYLAVLGRQPEISMAELEALFFNIKKVSGNLATFDIKPEIAENAKNANLNNNAPDINKLGGSIKIAQKINEPVLDFLAKLPEGKITLGVSDYSRGASTKTAGAEAMRLKKILTRHGRSVRVVRGDGAEISTATALHNGLSGKNPKKIELIKLNKEYYRVIGVQDIDAYARRDQDRPARDAKVGMLPPKLAQILINLCGDLDNIKNSGPEENSDKTTADTNTNASKRTSADTTADANTGANADINATAAASRTISNTRNRSSITILDPFCGTGVALQEAILMGYSAYGTDKEPKMIEYTKKNLDSFRLKNYTLEVGDATTHQWNLERKKDLGAPRKIDAVASECYLGRPMSKVPTEIEIKEQKQICGEIILKFLANLYEQIESGTPVTIATPAWLLKDGTYSRLNLIDEIDNMGYNVNNKSREGLLYHREGQIVARDIIILRKK